MDAWSSTEEYKPWKWGATARYYTSHTKATLPTRKSVLRPSRQLDHTKTSWPPWRDANCSGMVRSSVHQVWPKPLYKAQWKGEEDKADRGRGGMTTLGNGQAWSSPSHREQWRTGKNGGNWLWNHVWCPKDPRGWGIDEMMRDEKVNGSGRHNSERKTSKEKGEACTSLLRPPPPGLSRANLWTQCLQQRGLYFSADVDHVFHCIDTLCLYVTDSFERRDYASCTGIDK